MEADWEVEIGGGADVIEPNWAGFVDLRRTPKAAAKLPEAVNLPGLAQVLMQLNAAESPVWTAKCDVWEMEDFDPLELDAECVEDRTGVACYVDLLPRENVHWATHTDGAEWCRQMCGRLRAIALRNCRVDLVVRAAEFAGEPSGFAVTAYACAAGVDSIAARRRLGMTLAALTDTLMQQTASEDGAKKLQ